MSYYNGGATLRADINQALIEGPSADVGLIGAELMPLLPVDVKSGQYLKVELGGGELLNSDAAKRSPSSGYGRTSRKFTTDTYDCQEYGLEELVDDSFRADADRFFDLQASTARFILRNIKLSHELRVKSLIWASSTPFTTADQSPTAAYTAGNVTTIDVVKDVTDAKLSLNKLGYEANSVIMSAPIFELIRRTTLLQNQFFGVISNTGGRILSEQEVAAGLGVERVLVGRAAYNTAQKNKSYSGSFVVPNDKIVVANLQSGQFTAGGVGRTLVWSGDSAGGFVSETYRDEERRSDVLRVRMNTSEKIVDANAAVRITTSA